jgi:hypothetical protein
MLDVEVGQLGLWNLFDRFSVLDLHYFAMKLGLTVHSNSKQVIVGAISTGLDYIDDEDKRQA